MNQNSTLTKKTLCEILRDKTLNLATQHTYCLAVIEEIHGRELAESQKPSLINKLNKLKSKSKMFCNQSNWNNALRDHADFYEEEFEVDSRYFSESSGGILFEEESIYEAENEEKDEEEIELIEPEGEGYDFSQAENYDYSEGQDHEYSEEANNE
ncbi:hypothetical protein ACKWTF_012433 [Chironomus riparius]